jgi:hypothetical protein
MGREKRGSGPQSRAAVDQIGRNQTEGGQFAPLAGRASLGNGRDLSVRFVGSHVLVRVASPSLAR